MASIYRRSRDRSRKGRPWYISYTDEHERRRTVRGCTDKDAAKQLAKHLEDQAELRRRGERSADDDRLAEYGRRPIGEHVDAYLADCEHENQDATHIGNKRTQLNRLVEHVDAQRLADLEPNTVGRFLQYLKWEGKSHRPSTSTARRPLRS